MDGWIEGYIKGIVSCFLDVIDCFYLHFNFHFHLDFNLHSSNRLRG